MVIAFVANFTVFFLRIYYPWPYNLTLLAAAWLIIAVTLGVVVAQAVFRSGRITYHRIIGAILLYLLIAVTFATLFAFVGLSISNSFKGIAFEDDAALASSLFYLSFVTLSLTGYGDIVPFTARQKSLQYREHHRPALSGNISGETGNSRAGDQVRTYTAPALRRKLHELRMAATGRQACKKPEAGIGLHRPILPKVRTLASPGAWWGSGHNTLIEDIPVRRVIMGQAYLERKQAAGSQRFVCFRPMQLAGADLQMIFSEAL